MRSIKNTVLLVFYSVFFLLFSAITSWRFNIGQVFYYDFGHFARIIWLISQFSSPIIQHKVLGEIQFLGDHFSPSVYLLSPLFWITNNLQILLIEQVFATIIAGFLMYLISREKKLPFFVSLCFSGLFLLFTGVENPLVTDWHTESTAVVFLLLFIYLFFYKKKQIWGVLCAVIFMGFKDSNPLSLIFILIPFLFEQKKQRKNILLLMSFSFIWFFTVSYLLSPLITKQPYLYSPILPKNPIEFLTNFFNLPIKQKLLFDSFASFGFLPLFSGIYLLPIIGELSIRLVPTYIHSQSFTLGMHYNVFLGAFLTLASIQTFSYLSIFKKRKYAFLQYIFTSFFLLISLYVGKFITKPPILLATNLVFWKEWNTKTELFNQIKLIPKSGSVMSQNNILPHLLQRKENVYLLSFAYKKYQPEYILFDLSEGQNINNYYSGEINSIEQVIQLKKLISLDSSYKQIKTSYKDLFLFKKL